MTKFDKEILARNAAYGTIIGGLLGKRLGWPTELSAALGLILGPLVDVAIYRFKRWLQSKKPTR